MSDNAEQIDAKNQAFQTKVKQEQQVSAEFDALRGPYLAKREELNQVRGELEQLDSEMETLTKDYQAPARATAE